MNIYIVYFIVFCSSTKVFARQCCEGDDLIQAGKIPVCENKNKTYRNNVTIFSSCASMMIFTRGEENFTEQADALLFWSNFGDENQFQSKVEIIPTHQYCLGLIDNEENTGLEEAAVVCVEDDTTDHTTSAYCLLVSAIFLILTAILYASIWELRDLQGKSIISLCASFSIALGMLASLNLIYDADKVICTIKGFAAYFFTMSSFFWMNSISIQVLIKTRRKRITSNGWREYIYYAIYSWGCATILTVIAVVANYVVLGQHPPGIGYRSCWFTSIHEQWLYMNSILTTLIIINCAILLYVLIHLCRNNFYSTKVKALKYIFWLNLRLFIIMGISWILEVVDFRKNESHIVWFIIDLFNALQGLFIFMILVVFRRRALKAIYKRGWFFCLSDVVEKHLGKVDDDEETVVHGTIDQTDYDVGKVNGVSHQNEERIAVHTNT